MLKTRHCIEQIGKYYYIRWQWLCFWGYITQPMELWATDEIVDAPLKFRCFSLAEAYLAYWLENKHCKGL